jgi:hypothetical protein
MCYDDRKEYQQRDGVVQKVILAHGFYPSVYLNLGMKEDLERLMCPY